MAGPYKETQRSRLLQLLLAGESITNFEALERHKIGRLASRISELRAMGWPIIGELFSSEQGGRVSRYSLDFSAEWGSCGEQGGGADA